MKPLNVGELISKLETLNPTDSIGFDFGAQVPASLASYRGYYEQLAVGFTDEIFLKEAFPTVLDFASALKNMVGKQIEGYKGGLYTVTKDTLLRVAKWGTCSGTVIVDARKFDYKGVLLVTRYEDDIE